MTSGRYSVTAPGIDRTATTPGHALSLAQTLAYQVDGPIEILIRDLDETVVGRVVRDAHKTVHSYGGAA